MRRIRKRWVIFMLLLAALLIVGFLGYVKAVRTYNHIMAIRWYALDLESLISTPQVFADSVVLDRVQAEIKQVRAEIRGLRAEVEWFLPIAPHLDWVPTIGHDVASAPQLLEVGEYLVKAAEDTVISMRPIIEVLRIAPLGSNPGDSSGARLLPVLDAEKAKLTQVGQELELVADARRRIQSTQLSPTTQSWLDRADRLSIGLQTAIQAALATRSLLGAERPKSYLLIAQSNNELRATGGLLSAVELLVVENGRIVQLAFGDSGDVDDLAKRHPPPPAAFFKYMNIGVWYMRDANWSPDFPTSAQMILDFYKLDTGTQPDGVIAFDVVMAPWILDAIGPVQVPEFQEKVDGGTLLARVEYHWTAARTSPDVGRKDFMGAVLKAAILKINQGEGIVWPKLFAAIQRGIVEKHLLVYLRDRTLQESLAGASWDGAIRTVPGDYLMVVDSNLGYNKVNANISQSMEYQVDLREPEHPKASLTVTYTNASTISLEQCVRWPPVETTYARAQQGCYWDYMRVYVPYGSQLTAASGLNQPAPILDPREVDKSVFATFMILAPGEWRRVHFEYELPTSVLNSKSEYLLYVQKQLGTVAVPLQVQVVLPSGTAPVPGESNMTYSGSHASIISYAADLSRDRSLSLKLRSPEIRVQFQFSDWFWVLAAVIGAVFIAVGFKVRRRAR